MTALFNLPKTRHFVVVLFSAFFSVLPGFAAENSTAFAVSVEPVVYSTDAVPVRATGVLARKREADLSFKTGGVIEAVLVRVGDSVKKGQILAKLWQDEIQAQVAQARSNFEKAQRDLARQEKLRAGAVGTVEDLQNARTALELAAAQLKMAEFNSRYSVITAPEDGRILRRLAEPDELTEAGRAVLGFASDSEGWIVRAALAESDVASLRLGNQAVADGAPGKISQISEGTDVLTRTVPVEIALAVPPPHARSGMIAAVTLFPQPVAPRPVVPASVLIEGNGKKASLFLLEAGSQNARRVSVDVETLENTRAYLRTGLPKTARLIVQGGEYLQDGSVVAVKEQEQGVALSQAPGAVNHRLKTLTP
ncbi:MAG TPA: efflux RND transporter periplasmic adaptor subunit [Chthoniobacterales bacterium]